MEKKEYHWPNRPDWGDGPWKNEPDKVQWVDEATGLDCLMVRHESMGHWCGYVGVTEGHPAFNADYDETDVGVHGGLTFGSMCRESKQGEAYGVCHVPFAGRPGHVYWLGFDCAHSGDESPYMVKLRQTDPVFKKIQEDYKKYPKYQQCRETYRDVGYVEQEVTQLAKQLKELAA